MNDLFPMSDLVADDLLLDRLGGRGEAGGEPVAVLLGALAAHADTPLPARTGRRRTGRSHRYVGAFAALAVAASGAGVAAAVTLPDRGLSQADRARIEQKMEQSARSDAPSALLKRLGLPQVSGITETSGLVLYRRPDGRIVLLPASVVAAGNSSGELALAFGSDSTVPGGEPAGSTGSKGNAFGADQGGQGGNSAGSQGGDTQTGGSTDAGDDNGDDHGNDNGDEQEPQARPTPPPTGGDQGGDAKVGKGKNVVPPTPKPPPTGTPRPTPTGTPTADTLMSSPTPPTGRPSDSYNLRSTTPPPQPTPPASGDQDADLP